MWKMTQTAWIMLGILVVILLGVFVNAIVQGVVQYRKHMEEFEIQIAITHNAIRILIRAREFDALPRWYEVEMSVGELRSRALAIDNENRRKEGKLGHYYLGTGN